MAVSIAKNSHELSRSRLSQIETKWRCQHHRICDRVPRRRHGENAFRQPDIAEFAALAAGSEKTAP